jgi:hypothetical protein
MTPAPVSSSAAPSSGPSAAFTDLPFTGTAAVAANFCVFADELVLFTQTALILAQFHLVLHQNKI